jgi:hypothetical protein
VIDQDRIHTKATVIGVVFPVYDFKPPRIIGLFIRKLDNPAEKYLFAVCTYGISPGRTMLHVEKELKACGGNLAGGFVVHMPHNGIGSAAITGTQHEQMFTSWKQQGEVIYDYIQARKQGKLEPVIRLPASYSRIISESDSGHAAIIYAGITERVGFPGVNC